MEEKDILRVTAGFGAGMGRQQLTCGAVSGAYSEFIEKYLETSIWEECIEDAVEITEKLI